MSDSPSLTDPAPTAIDGRLLFPPIAAHATLGDIEEQMTEALGRLDAQLAA